MTVFALALPSGADAARRSLKYKLAQDSVENLTFEVEHVIATSFDRLPPEAEPYDTDSLEESLARVTVTASGRIERVVGRVFRDSSLGLVTRVVDLEGTVDRGAGAAAVSLDGIEGKSVSMRVLESGELLASTGWEHVAGAQRGGDLILPVFLLSVLRLPFDVPASGGAIPIAFRQRVPLDPLLNLDQGWDLEYRAADAPKECGRRCIALSYEGTATEVAEDNHPARPMKRASTATVRGTIVLQSKGRVFSHEFVQEWTHAVSSHRENDTLRAGLTQSQTITGRIAGEAVK
ncbi:MAG: hypothetical protein KDA24_14060 [Deltaproteobacteria bacterium]|nr:hypothetical protein [Deltaproteobacteria bacterium]